MSGAIWIGTYPKAGAEAPAGDGEGIWYASPGPDGAFSVRQVAVCAAPSFLALHPGGQDLLAVSETAPGAVTRFAVATDGSLAERERVTSGGAQPCHVLVHPSGEVVYVAQYGSGSLAVLPLVPADGDSGGWRFAGGLGQVFEHSGRGPHERQDGPHVHSTVLLPTDDGEVLLALDLGTDELRRFRVGDGGLLAADGLAGRLPHGSGPRHAAVTAAGHLLVVAELSAELYLLSWDRASATVSPLDRVQVAAPPALPSHVTVHGPGAAGPDELALVGVRATDRTDGGGPDGLAAVAVRGDRLDLRGRIGTGAWPRHHSQVGDLVWVAGQEAHEVQARRLDGGVGPAALSIPSPACVLPRP